MPKRALTAAAVERIKPPATGQVDHFDQGYPGLALRVSYGGRRSWVLFYRLAGKQRRYTLGTYPALGLAEAHKAWHTARAAVEAGRDPAGEKAEAKRKEPDTVRRIGELFIEKWHRPRNRTADEVARMLAQHVYPAIGDREINTVTRRDIRDLLDKAIEGGATKRVNRILANVRKLFSWAVEQDFIAASPVAGIAAPAPETRRERVLTHNEVRAFLRACEAVGEPFAPVLRLLLLTGQRRDEVAEAPWAEIDLANALWSLPGRRTKNGRAHIVPLSRQALAIIEALPSKCRSPLLFPAQFTRSAAAGPRSVSGFGRIKEKLDALMLAELKRVHGDEATLPEWRLHDLRRTAVTGMAEIRIAPHIVEAVVNHVSGHKNGVAGTYNRAVYADEKRAALAAWANFLDGLVSDKPANVVELRGAR
jgi:integrase